MYLYDLNEPVKISEPIRDQYDAIVRENIEKLWVVHLKSRNAMVQFAQDASGNYTDTLVYQYLQDVTTRGDLLNGWWWRLDLPSEINPLDGEEVEDENGDFHLYVGVEEGMLFELFDPDAKNYLDADGNKKTITTQWQSKFIRPGDQTQPVASDMHTDGVSGRAEPRWIEVRKEGSDASNWTLLIETAKGPVEPVLDSKSITVDFPAGEAIRRVAISGEIHAGEYLRVTCTNEEQDVENTILGIRIYYHVHPSQFEV